MGLMLLPQLQPKEGTNAMGTMSVRRVVSLISKGYIAWILSQANAGEFVWLVFGGRLPFII
jgi:hypothetical protein